MDRAWHQRFSGAAQAARAAAEHRDELDPDGCLARFGSQPTERENGRGQQLQAVTVAESCRMNFTQRGCEGLDRALDFGRLMGVWSE